MAITLLSARLVLRDISLADWPAVHAYASHPAVSRFQP